LGLQVAGDPREVPGPAESALGSTTATVLVLLVLGPLLPRTHTKDSIESSIASLSADHGRPACGVVVVWYGVALAST